LMIRIIRWRGSSAAGGAFVPSWLLPRLSTRRGSLRAQVQAGARLALLSFSCASVEGGGLSCHPQVALCHEEHLDSGGDGGRNSDAATMAASSVLASATAAASVLAAAAPALCAVHCAAMPIIAVALPSLQLASGGVCMHGVGRKLALYFVVPLGLISNAVGYSNHGSAAVTSTSLLGVSCVTAAATVRAVNLRRLLHAMVRPSVAWRLVG
jgi:hypothetical protein